MQNIVHTILQKCHHFVIGALNCILRKRVYRGRLHYLPYDEPAADEQRSTAHTNEDPEPQEKDDRPTTVDASEEEEVDSGKEAEIAIEVMVEDSQTEIVKPAQEDVITRTEDSSGKLISLETVPVQSKDEIEKEKTKPIEIDSATSELSVSSHLYPSSYTQALSESSRISASLHLQEGEIQKVENEDDSGKGKIAVGSRTRKTLQADLLPAKISDPVPSNWKTVEADFLTFGTFMISHMTSEFFGDPDMRIGSGRMRIIYFKNNVSRLGLLSVMSASESGRHMQLEEINTVDVKAYRLEPITAPGMLTVDGEVLPYGPIQIQVHSHLGRVMCRKRRATPAASA